MIKVINELEEKMVIAFILSKSIDPDRLRDAQSDWKKTFGDPAPNSFAQIDTGEESDEYNDKPGFGEDEDGEDILSDMYDKSRKVKSVNSNSSQTTDALNFQGDQMAV